jgi:hypothetical protein
MQAVWLGAAQCCGEKNYTISPRGSKPESAGRSLMAELKGRRYSIKVFQGSEGMNPVDDNVDVEVEFDDGSRYAATFFTLENLRRLFEKNERTGECKSGLYLWASDMIIVRELSEAVISETVADLLAQEEFEGAFSKLP